MVLILDRGAQETRHCVYVDNVGVIGSNGVSSLNEWKRLSNPSNAGVLKVHEQELHSGSVEALGVVLIGQLQCQRTTS